MEEFWILILVLFFATNLIDKAESVQFEELEELPLQTFDELFVEEWWDKDEADKDLERPPTIFGQNVHNQIDRQNTQIGQIEPNSTDQLGQIEPNSTDQNSSLTESDHSENAKNGEELIAEDERKRKIIDKFYAIKDEFKKIGKYSVKERVKIEENIAKHLKVNRTKIYKWKKEFGLSRKVFYKKEKRKHLVEKFDQKKAEFKWTRLKNSYHELDKTVAKELGLSYRTIYKWKSELDQTTPNQKYSQSKKKELMKRYYEIKDKTPKIRNVDIVKMLKIGKNTLYKWKKQFKRQQFHQNSVDGHSVEENAGSNIQEIGNSNLGSI